MTKNETFLIRKINECKSDIERLDASGIKTDGIRIERNARNKQLKQFEHQLSSLRDDIDTCIVPKLESEIAEVRKRMLESRARGENKLGVGDLGGNQMGLVTNELLKKLKDLEDQLVEVKRKQSKEKK
jgi:hypothetical protein